METSQSEPTPKRALRSLEALAELSDAAIDELSSLGEYHIHSAGTVLFSEGDVHDKIYFICSGTVTLDMVTANCGRQTILSVGRGDLLAWSAFVGDGIMTATAVAAEEVQAVSIQAEGLQKLLDAKPDLGYQVMRTVAQGLSRRLLATRLQLLDLYHP